MEEQRLLEESSLAYGDAAEDFVRREMSLAKKNICHYYVRLLRMVFKAMAFKSNQNFTLKRLKDVLSNSQPTIHLVLGVYREPSFSFFVDYLKQVLTEERFPELLLAIRLRPAQRIVMLRVAEDFLRSLHHPTYEYGWWSERSDQREAGVVTGILQAFKEQGIGHKEVLRLLEEAYSRMEIPLKKKANPNNLTRNFCRLMWETVNDARAHQFIGIDEYKELRGIYNRKRNRESLGSFRQLLGSEGLRNYISEHLVRSNRLVELILGNASSNCRTKLEMMECYSIFAKAMEDPESFAGWNKQ